MTRTVESGLRTAALRQIGSLMGARTLGRKKVAFIADQYELAAVQHDCNDLPLIECVNLTGMNPAR